MALSNFKPLTLLPFHACNMWFLLLVLFEAVAGRSLPFAPTYCCLSCALGAFGFPLYTQLPIIQRSDKALCMLMNSC